MEGTLQRREDRVQAPGVYYFHNCVYDFMWKNNRRRFAEKFPTWDIIRKYNKDYN